MRVIITGNTYPCRNALRNLGGRWNPGRKGWEFDKGMEGKALAAGRGLRSETLVPREDIADRHALAMVEAQEENAENFLRDSAFGFAGGYFG